jgi:Raf kinase inhibitor-like YbhB/YbcL family protein
VIGRLLRPVRTSAAGSPLSALATPPTLTVSSPSFTDGGPIPRVHAGKGVGDNISPQLRWSGVPAGTAELVLVMDDVDVPFPRPLIHTIAIVDPALTALDEGALAPGTAGLRFLRGTLREIGYTGPRPIPGHGAHHYRFLLFALDVAVPAAVTTSKGLLAAMAGHVLAAGVLTGTYQR